MSERCRQYGRQCRPVWSGSTLFAHTCLVWIYTVCPDLSVWKHLGDNCIQNFYLGKYIVGYKVGNFVWLQRASGAIKGNFWPYNRQDTATNENFEYSYPHSNVLLNIYLSKYFAPNVSFVSYVKPLRQQITSNVISLMTSVLQRYIAESTVDTNSWS